VTDLFEEVEEQLRSDRYRDLARKYLPLLLGLAAAAVLATLAYWGWDYYQRQTIAKASDTYAAAIAAMQTGDRDKAKQLWTDVSKSQAKAYKALSLMHLAAFEEQAKRTPEALKLLDEAAKAAPDPILGDLARLKSAFALIDTAPYKEVEGRLTPLMEDGRPYRLQAREALAFAKLMAGDMAGARGDFVVLSLSPSAGEGVQQRAQAAMGLIDSGSMKALPALVKAAVTAPPPMVVPPGATVPGGPPAGASAQAQPGAPQ
jgi:hypothetical protein